MWHKVVIIWSMTYKIHKRQNDCYINYRFILIWYGVYEKRIIHCVSTWIIISKLLRTLIFLIFKTKFRSIIYSRYLFVSVLKLKPPLVVFMSHVKTAAQGDAITLSVTTVVWTGRRRTGTTWQFRRLMEEGEEPPFQSPYTWTIQMTIGQSFVIIPIK